MKKALFLKDVMTGMVYVFDSCREAGRFIGVSGQLVNRAMRSGATIKKRYLATSGVRFYLVRTRDHGYQLCTYDSPNRKYVSVVGDETYSDSKYTAAKDVTLCLKNDRVLTGTGQTEFVDAESGDENNPF